jgi:hypothetical protein
MTDTVVLPLAEVHQRVEAYSTRRVLAPCRAGLSLG